MKSGNFKDEIKKLGEADLKEKARSVSEELMKLRFRRTIGQLAQGHLFKELRRNRARVLTQLKTIKSK